MNKFIEELNDDVFGLDVFTDESKKKTVTIQDLVGVHTFTGFSTESVTTPDHYSRDANVAIFVLDDVTYRALEDPDDGYRSYMDEITITNEKCTNMIPVHFVKGNLDEDSDIINFVDIVTKEIVLSIGTDHSDNYYPSCVSDFFPKNLAINKDPKGYQKTLREYKLKRILK
jgi:hypothetical protein